MASSIRNFPFPHISRFFCVLTIAGIFCGGVAHADLNSDATPRLKKKPEGVVHPTAVVEPGAAEVNRGGEVTLTLRGIARGGGEIEFKLTQRPQHGKIVRTSRASLDTLSVIYRHSGTRASDEDRLRFSVRSRGLGPFSPGEIIIKVRDLPGQLLVPDDIDFQPTLVGDTVTESFVVINEGGLPVKGLIRASPPWRLVGGENYSLAPDGKRKLAVVFEPTSGGRFQGQIFFDGTPTATVALKGEGIAPFLASPASLELAPGLDGGRSGIISLQNNRPESIVVQIKSDYPLPEEVTLQFGEVRELEISDSSIGSVATTITFATGNYTTRVQVTARELDTPPPAPTSTPVPSPAPAPLPSPVPAATPRPGPSPLFLATPTPELPTAEIAPEMPEIVPRKKFLQAELIEENSSRIRVVWPLAAGNAIQHFQIEQRVVRADEQGKPRVEWVPVKSARLQAEGGQGLAIIDGLNANNRFVFRVVHGPGGMETLTSLPLTHTTPPGWREKWRWHWLLFFLAGVLIFFVLRKRWRERSGGW